jgi:Domain of unknown function (DUF4037)
MSMWARLVEALMKLRFLMEKKYAPYSKWFGTAFNELRWSQKLAPIFAKVGTGVVARHSSG